MSEDHRVGRKSQLVSIVDDLFAVLEEEYRLLSNWKPHYHTLFIEHLWTLKKLECDLSALGYREDFILTVEQAVYRSVFGDIER